ncbi:MAG TPA: hypothetical protein VH206_01260 [Xanthobacteraceae bacterium]|jgi:hypothetical protein|nr:hypothetical protein [Xanthobacteraceae bacterium]
MEIRPLFPIHHLSSHNRNSDKTEKSKSWIKSAILEEELRPSIQLWFGEIAEDLQIKERLRLIRLLRKRSNRTSASLALAERLELCEPGDRCLSGACPECGRLFQRWLVRRLGKLIENHIDKPDHELVAITIIPLELAVPPGRLNTVSLENAQRRLKRALKKADIKVAFVGIDFSLDEDSEGAYSPFWSPHFYLITAVAKRRATTRILGKLFRKAPGIRKPVQTMPFDNSTYRRSYAYKIKFERRIGFTTERSDGRECRNTRPDKFRALERTELLTYLDKVGFSQRSIFLGIEPYVRDSKARIRPIPSGRRGNRANRKNWR